LLLITMITLVLIQFAAVVKIEKCYYC